MVYESESIMNYLGFNPSLVDGFAELCDKALTEAGLLGMERDDVREDIDELVRMTLRDGMGYDGDFEPCDIIIDAIGQATCDELKELFPEEEFTYIAGGVYSELHINGEVYDGTKHLNSFLQNYHNDQQLFENFTVLSKGTMEKKAALVLAIELSSDDLELALLRCGATAADARATACEFEETRDNPHCPETVKVLVSRSSDNITMHITDWTKCDAKDWKRYWDCGKYPDNPNEYSVPLTKEEKARFEDAMQREFDNRLKPKELGER